MIRDLQEDMAILGDSMGHRKPPLLWFGKPGGGKFLRGKIAIFCLKSWIPSRISRILGLLKPWTKILAFLEETWIKT